MKTMMKTMAAALVCAAFAPVAMADTITIDSVTWTYVTNGDTTTDGSTAVSLGASGITKAADCTDSTRAVPAATSVDAATIPWTFTDDGVSYTVTQINGYAFYQNTGLYGTLTIPDAVTVLGVNAFRSCTNLTGFSGGSSVTSWGNWALGDCSNMTGTFPDLTAATTIGEDVFNGPTLTGDLKLGSSITKITRLAFQGCYFPVAIVPTNVTQIGTDTAYGTFLDNTNLTSIWVKGPAASGSYTTVYVNKFANNCTSLKMILMGPNTKGGRMGGAVVDKTTNVQILVPNNEYWDGDWTKASGTNTKVWKYGEGQELDLAIDEDAGTITFYPTTEDSLTNVVALASTIKDDLGLDTVISITNSIEMTEGMTLTTEDLQNVTFQSPPWFITFKVQTQTQLNNVLAVVDEDLPIIIEITGLNEEITVPEGRKVAILANDTETFMKKKSGLIIIFR